LVNGVKGDRHRQEKQSKADDLGRLLSMEIVKDRQEKKGVN
jgi:hypothetical protein